MLQQGLACCEAPSDPGTFALGTARAPGTRATVAQRGPIGPHLCTEGTLSPALPSHLILHSHGKFLPPPLNPLTVCSWAQGHLHREEGIAPSGPQTTPLSALAPIESELESPHRRAVPSQKGDRTLLAGGRSVHPRGPPALPPPAPAPPPSSSGASGPSQQLCPTRHARVQPVASPSLLGSLIVSEHPGPSGAP